MSSVSGGTSPRQQLEPSPRGAVSSLPANTEARPTIFNLTARPQPAVGGDLFARLILDRTPPGTHPRTHRLMTWPAPPRNPDFGNAGSAAQYSAIEPNSSLPARAVTQLRFRCALAQPVGGAHRCYPALAPGLAHSVAAPVASASMVIGATR